MRHQFDVVAGNYTVYHREDGEADYEGYHAGREERWLLFAREVLRLAEENAALTGRLALLTDEESQWQAKKAIEAAERARIRRELLKTLERLTGDGRGMVLAHLRLEINRIVPEEG